MAEKRIAVVGTGANGAAIAADLTNAGLDVTCIEQWPAHVEAIRKRVTAAFQGKDILIGEVGWPSAGRMREGALPSPV